MSSLPPNLWWFAGVQAVVTAVVVGAASVVMKHIADRRFERFRSGLALDVSKQSASYTTLYGRRIDGVARLYSDYTNALWFTIRIISPFWSSVAPLKREWEESQEAMKSLWRTYGEMQLYLPKDDAELVFDQMKKLRAMYDEIGLHIQNEIALGEQGSQYPDVFSELWHKYDPPMQESRERVTSVVRSLIGT